MLGKKNSHSQQQQFWAWERKSFLLWSIYRICHCGYEEKKNEKKTQNLAFFYEKF